MEKREKKFLIAGIIFSVIMIVFSYTAITSKNGEQAEISKGSVQYQETKSQISIGETINNKLEGSGIQRSKSGNIYSGNFENGKKNGKGEYTYQNGSTYKGTFENSCFKDGELILKDEQGVFEIQIKDGKIEGKVKAELINGDSYKGNLANGKFNGECEITYSGGDTYIGTVKDDLKSGEGTYQWSETGDSYTGNWKKDKMNGKGTYYYSWNEYLYLKGDFSNNKPKGTCTYYKSKKTHFNTYWKKGTCVKAAY